MWNIEVYHIPSCPNSSHWYYETCKYCKVLLQSSYFFWFPELVLNITYFSLKKYLKSEQFIFWLIGLQIGRAQRMLGSTNRVLRVQSVSNGCSDFSEGALQMICSFLPAIHWNVIIDLSRFVAILNAPNGWLVTMPLLDARNDLQRSSKGLAQRARHNIQKKRLWGGRKTHQPTNYWPLGYGRLT